MNLQMMTWMEFLHKTALELKIHLLAVGPGLGNVSGTSIENKNKPKFTTQLQTNIQ